MLLFTNDFFRYAIVLVNIVNYQKIIQNWFSFYTDFKMSQQS